jgi:hypothetical protein
MPEERRFTDFVQWPAIRMSRSRQLHLTEAELERIGNTRIDSNEVVEVVMALKEAFQVRIEI